LASDLLGTLISFFTSAILPSWVVAGLLSLFIAGYLAHYVRHRGESIEKQKIVTATMDQNATEAEAIDIPVNAFDRTQRVVHWLFAAVLVFLTVTGFEIYYYPNVASSALTVFSLVYHSNISTILLLLIAVHVFHDMRKPTASKQMSPSSFDFKMLISRTRNFLSPSKMAGSFKAGKYDVFMKSYHWTLTALLGVLGITGLYFWDPYGIISTRLNLSKSIQSLLLNLHILSAVVVLGMIIGHVYFARLTVNRPFMQSMINGQLDNKYYSQNHDPELWVPNIVVVKSSKLMRLTRALPDPVFLKLTGYKNRNILGSKSKFPVPFLLIQKTCGNHFAAKGVGRCRAKNGAICSPEKCPALGTFVTEMVRAERRKTITRMTVGAIAVGLVALGIGYSFRIATSARSTSARNTSSTKQISSQTTSQQQQQSQTSTTKPLANIKTMANNSSVNFFDSQGYPYILIRLSSGTVDAYSAICTHAGCEVSYDSSYEVIYCPCHGATFDPSNGSVTRGPAFSPLPSVKIRIDQTTGNVYLG